MTMAPADQSFAVHDVFIIVLLVGIIVEMFWIVWAYARRSKKGG